MELDCCFTKENQWFRYRVGAVIIEDGCVLMAKNERDSYYYSVGGGVHHGETAKDAVCREVFEETGVPFEVDRLVFLHENFFHGSESMDGLICHEISFYFLMKPRNTKKLRDGYTSSSGGIAEHMHWIPLEQLSSVKAFPVFFRKKLKNIREQTEIEHIVTIEH